jgi:superfamily I DNA/RNA helicase
VDETMNELNEAQKDAVTVGTGVFQVLAGPGSGKTRVIAARHERLWNLGNTVLTLTLTRAAADEMRKRTAIASRTAFRTFHSLAYEIVYGLQKNPSKELDFDLLIHDAYWKILNDPACGRGKYRYDFVQVDEAQDCSSAEWDLLWLLSPNLFCVGDGMQAIYSFRGTKADVFLNMAKECPPVTTLYLGANYRSTRMIVDYCKSIAPIRGEFLEHMCSVQEEGQPVEFHGFPNNVAEAEAVRNFVMTKLPSSDTTAILARTKHQLNIFRKLKMSEKIDLTTIHAAKGKEWDNVFVIGCQEGLLPHKDGDRSEEGRILFVACSRAKRRLFLTSYGGAHDA